MVRSAPALLLAAVVFGACGSDEPTTAQPSGHANLSITVDNDGAQGQPAKELKLDCAKPSDSAACKVAAGMTAADFAPTPANQACTMIFAGPETATVSGTLHGTAVDAKFSRADGCEVDRWTRVEPLLADVR